MPTPPSPAPPAGQHYECISARCVVVQQSGSHHSPNCEGSCSPLSEAEWLAVQQHSVLSSGNRTLTISIPAKVQKNTSYLKKGELLAAALPASMKQQVAQGDILHLQRPATVFDDVYYLVLLGQIDS